MVGEAGLLDGVALTAHLLGEAVVHRQPGRSSGSGTDAPWSARSRMKLVTALNPRAAAMARLPLSSR